MTANAGKNFIEQPVFELDCGGKLAGCDQPVDVTLAYEDRFLSASEAVEDGVAIHHPTAMLLDCVGSVLVAECCCDVLRAVFDALTFDMNADCVRMEVECL